MKNNELKPGIYMYVDTTGKTTAEIKAEVINRVNETMAANILPLRNKVSELEFELIEAIIELEKLKIIESYMRQIDALSTVAG